MPIIDPPGPQEEEKAQEEAVKIHEEWVHHDPGSQTADGLKTHVEPQ